VRYSTHQKKRIGVCSTFLSDQVTVGDSIAIFVNNNPDFRMPEDPQKQILMIGPGTGVAPFRAMMQERVLSNMAGEATLYFGCRNSKDFLYKEELESHQQQNKLKLYTAFSREQSKKVYVQHKLKENSEQVWQFLENGGAIYVCGDAAHMAGDVHQVLFEIISQYGNLDKESTEKYLHHLENDRRYQKDTWF